MSNATSTNKSQVKALLQDPGNREQLESLLDKLDPAELLHTVFQLSSVDQRALLSAVFCRSSRRPD